MIQMTVTRHIAILVLFALVVSLASSLAAEFASTCDDCCGESACDDCILCWCCSAVPAVIVVEPAEVAVPRAVEVVEVLHHQSVESLCYELLDPPPRS